MLAVPRVAACGLLQSRAAVGVEDPYADKDEKAAALKQQMELQKAASVRFCACCCRALLCYVHVTFAFVFQEAAPGAAEEFTDKEIEDAFRCAMLVLLFADHSFDMLSLPDSSTWTRTCL
jgi:hypothetical protein